MKTGEPMRKHEKGRLIVSVVLLLISFSVLISCMDPGDYEPEGPPEKPEPPGPPVMLTPTQDAEFHCREYAWVQFDWTPVEGAQDYEIQYDTSASFTYAFPYPAYPPASFSLIFYAPMTTYYARVRAYSSAWTWYTEWSDPRRFYLLPSSGDTIFPTR